MELPRRGVTDENRTVLKFLVNRMEPHEPRCLALKQPDSVSSFEDRPGGSTTFAELLDLGYIDDRNLITQAGEEARLKP